MCPGRANAECVTLGSASARNVAARSDAEMPVVTDPAMVTRLTPSLAHGAHGSILPSANDFEDHLQHLHSTQDIEIVIESMIAEGDEVATNNITRRHYRDGRFMTTRYLSFYRLKDGRIVEKTDVY
ncbi:MAG: SnoaL-like polyketide cyclase, partial [Actinomycetota bacterium]